MAGQGGVGGLEVGVVGEPVVEGGTVDAGGGGGHGQGAAGGEFGQGVALAGGELLGNCAEQSQIRRGRRKVSGWGGHGKGPPFD